MLTMGQRWANAYSPSIIHEYQRNILQTEEASTDLGSNVTQDTINDQITRKKLWHSLFGSENMPVQEDDAVDKYAGSLRSDFPNVSNEDIEKSLSDAKEK